MASGNYIEPLTQREMDILQLLAEGLSNREIAQRLVIAPETVKWYNKQLYSKLGVHNRKQAVATARDAGLLDTPSKSHEGLEFPPRHNLPAQVTSFIGRQREISEVQQLLDISRLLTLTGPPGTGKTRLALQVASKVFHQFKDGVYFVELAPISDAQFVPSTIAQVFNLGETGSESLEENLKNYLRNKQLLLVLDNYEQIIETAPLVSSLLLVAPGLKVMITSRQVLQIYGEQEYGVPPLNVPKLGSMDEFRILSQYESVELFCQRAQAVKPDFNLTEENTPVIAEICVRLDGLPLAIELAAARSKMLSPKMIRDRLGNRLDMLTVGARDLPSRLQTLRGTIDWSYDLLDEGEKILFARLSVFQGGRTIESAEEVCGLGLSIQVIDGLESLLNKSLLHKEEGSGGESRFTMLETIHEYARERLMQSGEESNVMLRHVLFFVSLAERAEIELVESRQEYWYARLEDERDNIRAALNWAIENFNVEMGARLVAALRDFWYYKGFLLDGSTWIERFLELERELSPIIQAKLLNTSSRLAFACGDHVEGERIARNALSLARDHDDKENYAWALIWLSGHQMATNDQNASTFAEEGLHLFRELDHKAGIGYALNTLGELSRQIGDYARAGQLYDECVTLSKEVGNKQREAVSLANLVYVAYHQGNHNLAIDYGNRAIALFQSLKMDYGSAIVLAMIAGPIGAKGEPERAAYILSASEAHLKTIGARIQPGDQFEVDQFKDEVRKQLGEIEFNKAWAEGSSITLEQALSNVAG